MKMFVMMFVLSYFPRNNDKERVCTTTPTATSTSENGKTTNSRAMVSTCSKTENAMRESCGEAVKKAKASTSTQTGTPILVYGMTTRNLATESTYTNVF